jgi:hypothetical protein
MKKALSIFLIIAAIYWSFSALMPSKTLKSDDTLSTFSTDLALEHLKNISKTPHYVGTPEHNKSKRVHC